MNQEFIPYEQALELKKLGFDEECLKKQYHHENNSLNVHFPNDLDCQIPLYQQAFRWFREKHEMYVHTYALVNTETQKLHFTNNINDREGVFYATHEEAELACLKELIEIVKNK